MEDDDPVVQQLDVYFNNAAEVDLHIVQFPLKPIYSGQPAIKSTNYKPNCKKLQVEVGVNENDDAHVMSMVSSVIAKKAILTIGYMTNNELHLTPLNDVLQMRPSFSNLPSISFDNNNEEDADGDAMDDDDDNNFSEGNKYSKGNKGLTLEQVHMKRKETERSQALKMQSWAFKESKELNESYQELKINHEQHQYTMKIKDKLKYKK